MKDEPLRRALLIAGPKASGKSAIALRAGSALVSSTPIRCRSTPASASSPPAERKDARQAPHRLFCEVGGGQLFGQAAGRGARETRPIRFLRRTFLRRGRHSSQS